jgi:hypothetical protein
MLACKSAGGEYCALDQDRTFGITAQNCEDHIPQTRSTNLRNTHYAAGMVRRLQWIPKGTRTVPLMEACENGDDAPCDELFDIGVLLIADEKTKHNANVYTGLFFMALPAVAVLLWRDSARRWRSK